MLVLCKGTHQDVLTIGMKRDDPPRVIVWNALNQGFPNKGFKSPTIKPRLAKRVNRLMI